MSTAPGGPTGQPPGALPAHASTAPAAVVVNYEARDALLGCVASLRASGAGQVVVVDNASSDGSLERLAAADPRAVVIPAGRNLGYGTAANLGVARTTSEHVLVCNPDVVAVGDCVAALSRVLDEHPECAVVGPRIDNPDGTRYPSARAFPSWGVAAGHAFLGPVAPGNRWTRRYKMEESEAGEEAPGEPRGGCREAGWVSGACFMARRSAFESLGGFDERYFMYAEDVDLCWRARRAGWSVLYEPAASVVHAQGLSTSRRPVAMTIAHHRSAWRFARRSTGGAERALLPLVALGLAVRLAVSLGRALGHPGSDLDLPEPSDASDASDGA
ncbi:MAG: glycosyltransferase family 2 protein [Acidimicrobiales bacterium]